MLPEELSNELCSLKGGVDRLCMVCDIAVDSHGNIVEYRFYPAVMHSRARLTYNQVWDWLSQPSQAKSAHAKALLPHLQNLHALYKLLSAARAKRGAIDFDTVELALEFDTRGKIEAIVPVARNDAHKLIEECMLAANVCTAGYLLAQKQPALFRVHQGPTPEKLEALKEFLAGSDYRFPEATIPRRPITHDSSRRSAAGPISTCCKRSCCARCSRRSTARRTSGISDSAMTRIRISRRRSGVIPIS